MSHRAESSSSSRATRRQARGASSIQLHGAAYPVGKETGLPLIICPDCGMVRVIELRVMSDTPNKGRSFFKCPRNGNPKLCGFYRFQKEYFDELVYKKIVRVSCEQFEEMEQEWEGTETGSPEKTPKELEMKLEKMMWKLNLVIGFVAIVVVEVVVKYVVMA